MQIAKNIQTDGAKVLTASRKADRRTDRLEVEDRACNSSGGLGDTGHPHSRLSADALAHVRGDAC